MKNATLLIIVLCLSASLLYGQNNSDTIHYFSETFPENGSFIRPDSLPDGIWIAYCKTNKDQIGLKITYKNGNRNGETISFWPNGNIQQKGFYKNGCLIGKNEKWYKNGIKEDESFCIADDYKKHFYHCNQVNYWAKDGKQLIKDGTGKYISYWDNDTLQISGDYINGLQNGQWIWHYPNGAIQIIENFSEGVHEGEFTLYYLTGQVLNKGIYKNGKQVGVWNDWYPDGVNEQQETRVNGLRDGEYKYWHTNGQLSQFGNYKLGKQDGLWKQWDEKGKLISEETFLNGKIINRKSIKN